MTLTVPKLRMWHLLGIIAAVAAYIAVFQYCWTVEDDGYAALRRLRSSDASIRAKAASSLMTIEPLIRASSAIDLESFGPRAAEAVSALIRCLNDREPDVRRASASALGQLGPSAAVVIPTLAKLAESDPDDKVRRSSTLSRAILLGGQTIAEAPIP